MSTVSVNGTELYVQDVGPRDATALVFCHSLFFTADMFAAQVERFAKDYRSCLYLVVVLFLFLSWWWWW
jgi:3-oxoadipate enol-lactonase